jgi:signal transduction histidine kinase
VDVAVDQLGPRSLRRLLDAVLAIGSELDLDMALRHIVETATSLVDARYGALGVLDESRNELSAFITVGVDAETHRAIGRLPKGLGLLGALIVDARPLRVPVIDEHPDRSGFPPKHPPMTSFLGVPIVSQGKVFGNLYLTDKTTAEVFNDLDEQLASGLAAAAGIVIHNARLHGHVRRRDAALTAVHEVVAAVAGEREGQAALQLVADRACVLAGADVATIALPSDGGDTLEVAVVAGAASAAFLGDRFPVAGSVSGEVIATGRPVVLADASGDYRTAQPQVRHGQIGPAMWVPLTAYGTPVGTLGVGRATESEPFTDAELDLVLLFAAHASVIVEVDRGRDDARRLSILEDQERIARDLHDTVIQRLFATGLSLQSLCRLTDEPTTSRILAAIDELDGTIRQIRTVIFGLERPTSGPSTALRGRVLDLCAEAARVLGFEPTVGFSGPIDTVTGGELADEIVAVLREALSNVSRHAAANSVAVDVTADDETVTLIVSDDGRGLDTGTELGGGQGLENMRVRALRRSGRFELTARPDGGTLLLWSSPHTR